jgi:hypothetical protein
MDRLSVASARTMARRPPNVPYPGRRPSLGRSQAVAPSAQHGGEQVLRKIAVRLDLHAIQGHAPATARRLTARSDAQPGVVRALGPTLGWGRADRLKAPITRRRGQRPTDPLDAEPATVSEGAPEEPELLSAEEATPTSPAPPSGQPQGGVPTLEAATGADGGHRKRQRRRYPSRPDGPEVVGEHHRPPYRGPPRDWSGAPLSSSRLHHRCERGATMAIPDLPRGRPDGPVHPPKDRAVAAVAGAAERGRR